MAGESTVNPAPWLGPRPQDLVLPDAQEKPLPIVVSYKVPEEFWDEKAKSLHGLNTQPQFAGIFGDVSSFFQTIFSVGGVVPKPRNMVDFVTHPRDYVHGEVESTVAEKNRSGEDPRKYTFMDEDWKSAQQVATAVSVGGAFALSTWAGSRNVDGRGRSPILPGLRDPLTGRRSVGVLPFSLLISAFFLVGSSITSQYRLLQHEGYSPAEAYMLSAFPLTGWPLTFEEEEHYFLDDTHASFTSTAVNMAYSQYFMRFTGIASVLGYALTCADDLRPFVQQQITLLRPQLYAAQARLSALAAVPEAELSDDARKTLEKEKAELSKKLQQLERQEAQAMQLVGLERYQGQAGVDRMKAEIGIVDERLAAVEQNKIEVKSRIAAQPSNSSLVERLGALENEHAGLHAYRQQLIGHAESLAAGETLHFTRNVSRSGVRRLALQVMRMGRQAGAALDNLEAARDWRTRFTPFEQARYQTASRMQRFGMRVTSGFASGRWRVRAASFGISSVLSWAFYGVLYHYQRDKGWSDSFWSSASMFYTMPLNEPVVGYYRAAGVSRVPYGVQFIASIAALNLIQSAGALDNDIFLQRCKFDRANLFRSLDPEWREKTRARLARWYDAASEKERSMWSVSLEDGGCGLAPPKLLEQRKEEEETGDWDLISEQFRRLFDRPI